MCGVLAADTVMHQRPVGRGYTRLRENTAMPWPAGDKADTQRAFNAHEFHYSSLENLSPDLRFCYSVERGTGIDGRHDGIVHHNLVANYAHLRHVRDSPWVDRFVAFVRETRRSAYNPATPLNVTKVTAP